MLEYEVSSWAMCSQDQEGRRHGQQARGEEGVVVGGPERGLGDGDPGGQKIFRVIRKYLLAMHLVLSSSTPCRCSPCALLAWHSYRPRSASVTPRIWGGNMKWVSLFKKTSTLVDETEPNFNINQNAQEIKDNSVLHIVWFTSYIISSKMPFS